MSNSRTSQFERAARGMLPIVMRVSGGSVMLIAPNHSFAGRMWAPTSLILTYAFGMRALGDFLPTSRRLKHLICGIQLLVKGMRKN
jgi:hypothetical protein